MARIREAVLMYCAFSVTPLAGITAEGALTPRTITTQDRLGAVILWDATPYVDRFVQQGTPMRDALKTLEADAVMLFIRNAASLHHQRHLRVVVSYVQTGATEARYQTKTFAGVKTILSVEGNISPRMRLPNGWENSLQRGVSPAGLKINVANDLPSDKQ